MGELDKEYLNKGWSFNGSFKDFLSGNFGWNWNLNQKRAAEESYDSSMSVLDGLSTSDITSRDQIINPYEIIDPSTYANNAEGRAQYQSDLNRAIQIAEQQKAAYEEWYNSESQQAIRQREAGLNPDILGVGQSSAGDAQTIQGNPLEGVPTQLEQLTTGVNSFASIVGAVSQVAALPNLFMQNKNLGLLNDEKLLSNLTTFESLSGNEIFNRLSDAISSTDGTFDIASWFADDNNFANIYESYAPNDSASYRSAFSNVRKRMQSNLSKAYEQGALTKENRRSFKARCYDPTYSPDELIQRAALEPLVNAKLEESLAVSEYNAELAKWNTKYQQSLDVDKAVELANSQNEFDAAYIQNRDAEKEALTKKLQDKVLRIRARMEAAINQNYLDLYEAHSSDAIGISAGYLYTSGAASSYAQYFGASAVAFGFEDIEEPFPIFDENGVPVTIDNGQPIRLGAPSDQKISPSSFR